MRMVKTLLKDVSTLQKHSLEIAKLKGENFNIFSVIRRESDEVVVHNRFIAEMLNPKGSHGLGTIPMKCFFKHIIEKFSWGKQEHEENEKTNEEKGLIDKIFSTKFRVKAEHYLGTITEDKAYGGFVDVAMLSNDFNIFIESKIHAGEQKNQLLRYKNDKCNTPNLVFYLTLDGKKANNAGHLVADTDYLRLSYASDIINWLSEVNKYALDFPILRETIKQYINLLKKLTGQLNNQKMQDKLINLMSNNADNYAAAKLIHENFKKVDESIFTDVYQRLEVKLNKKFDRSKDSRDDGGFATVFSIELEEKKYNIGIQLELRNRYMFICAIEKMNKRVTINQSPILDDIAKALSENKLLNNSVSRTSYCLLGTFPFDFELQGYLVGSEQYKTKTVEDIVNVYNDVNKIAQSTDPLFTKKK